MILAVVVLVVAILYYATPNVKQPKFRWISIGAAIAVVVWILASVGFGFYVANFSSYNKTYGSLAGVIVFLLWLWITNLALLFGAEVDSEIERGRQLQGGFPPRRPCSCRRGTPRRVTRRRPRTPKTVRSRDRSVRPPVRITAELPAGHEWRLPPHACPRSGWLPRQGTASISDRRDLRPRSNSEPPFEPEMDYPREDRQGCVHPCPGTGSDRGCGAGNRRSDGSVVVVPVVAAESSTGLPVLCGHGQSAPPSYRSWAVGPAMNTIPAAAALRQVGTRIRPSKTL